MVQAAELSTRDDKKKNVEKYIRNYYLFAKQKGGAPLTLEDCNGEDYQLWRVEEGGRIVNVGLPTQMQKQPSSDEVVAWDQDNGGNE